MPKTTTVEIVKDGWIKRDAASGRFIEVSREGKVGGQAMVVRKMSASALSQTSSKRSAALERLKNR